jgi:hypothetical protein
MRTGAGISRGVGEMNRISQPVQEKILGEMQLNAL